MSSRFAEHVLPNGLRIVCETMPAVRSVAVAFLVRTGARDETLAEHGVSHFLEHMSFKGTPTRSSIDVNVRFDELGSIYNAFTGKEHTVYYGWVPVDRLEPQLELLADMLRPSLPPDDYETERKVVLEEIAMSEDSFEHHLYGFLHEVCFGAPRAAHEILGERATIEGLPRDAMLDYHRRRYAPSNVVLLVAGAVEPEVVFALAARYCGQWGREHVQRHNGAALAAAPTGVLKRVLPQFKQQSVVLVYPAPRGGTPDDEPLDAFVSLFAGGNSRCFWNITQKGICSDAGVAWLAYRDCGLLAFYADGEPERCAEMLAALRGEIARVADGGFTDAEVQRVRNRRRTHVALDTESPHTRLMQLVDDLETLGGVQTPEASLAAVAAVTNERIADVLRRYPTTGDGLLLSVGPRDWP